MWDSFLLKVYNKIKEDTDMDREMRFLSVEDVMELTGLSRTGSYNLIRSMNEELRKKGCMIIRGRIITTYFYDCFFGKDGNYDACIQRKK